MFSKKNANTRVNFFLALAEKLDVWYLKNHRRKHSEDLNKSSQNGTSFVLMSLYIQSVTKMM